MDTNVNIVIISNKDDNHRCKRCCCNCITSFYGCCKRDVPEVLIGILILLSGVLVAVSILYILSFLVGSLVIYGGLSCEKCNQCFACTENISGAYKPLIVGLITIVVTLLVPMFDVCIGFILYNAVIEDIFVVDCLIGDKLDSDQHTLKKNNKGYYVVKRGIKDAESHQFPCKIVRKYHYITHIMTYVLTYVINYIIVIMLNKFVLYTALAIPVSLIIDVPAQWVVYKICPEYIKQLCEKITIFDLI